MTSSASVRPLRIPPAPPVKPVPVDLRLVLAIDSSSSVQMSQYYLQLQGYAAAFRHPDVLAAVRSGMQILLWGREYLNWNTRLVMGYQSTQAMKLAILRGDGHILPQSVLTKVVNEVSDAVVGLGPIEFLLRDPDVTEVMVNSLDSIFVERNGRLYRTQERYLSEEHLRQVIERIVSRVGRRIDESSPMVDARLPDGSTVHCSRITSPLVKRSVSGRGLPPLMWATRSAT